MKIKPVYVIFLLSFIVASALASGARQITTFTISYADPAQIQSVVRSYLSADSSVTLYQNRLILNATEAEIAKTQALLRQLDVGGRQLLISVKTSGQASQNQRQFAVSGSVAADARLHTQTHATVTVENYQSKATKSGGQGVRATEGRPAFVSVGSSAPIQHYQTTADGRLIQQHETISASSGFYATAWVTDHTVRVNIDQQRQQLNGRVVAGQQLQSEVSGELGVWLPVGTINSSSGQSGSGILRHESGQSASGETIYLKVEMVN